MKKNLKLFSLGAAMLLSVGVLVSCGSTDVDDGDTDGKTIDLVFSGPNTDLEFYNSVFAKFKEAKAAEGDKNTYNITFVNHG